MSTLREHAEFLVNQVVGTMAMEGENLLTELDVMTMILKTEADLLCEWKERIDQMSHEELARLYRFSPSHHMVIQTPELWAYFAARFESFGGMAPEISKRIGWTN